MLLLLLPAALPSALAWSLRTPRPVMHLSEYALFSGRLAEPKLQATAVELAERRLWRGQLQKEVLLFAGPALSTVLADPLMSVVDSLCCGRFCATLQLASLGPSLAVFSFVNNCFFFLNAATTVLVTRALASGDAESAASVLSNAVLLAIGCGAALALVLFSCAAQVVAATGCVPELIPTAARYLRVRSVGQPAVLASMVVQSGLLAQRDAVTPLQVISAACTLNIVGDLLLVPRLGAPGAAWATLAAQLLALPLMLALSSARQRLPVQLRRPRLREWRRFVATAAPLLSFEMGLNACYSLVISLSTQFSVASAAAFQALWTPFSVLCFASYPLKQAAQAHRPAAQLRCPAAPLARPPRRGVVQRCQTACLRSHIHAHAHATHAWQVFLPRILGEEQPTVGGAPKAREFTRMLAGLAGACGVGLALAGAGLACHPACLTADASLWPLVTSFAPYVAAALLVMGGAQAFEGVLLATNDLGFLSISQLVNGLAAIGCLGLSKGAGIHGAWIVLLAFMASRALQAVLRVFVVQRPWAETEAAGQREDGAGTQPGLV
jgi:Na+-driven multidrug efflux pump